MKMNKWLAAVLTALFLALFFNAYGEAAPDFSIDRNTVFRGMERSWSQGYEPAISRGKWELVLPVRTAEDVQQVTAELVIPEGRLTPFKAQAMTVQGREEEKGLWEIRFTLSLLSDRKNSDFPCVIRLNGKDAAGKDLTMDIPYVIQFRGAKEEIEKARISVDDVQAELSVGETGEIRVTLSNPCAATVIRDLELKISDAAGHILPDGAEALRIGTLSVDESVTVNYPVTVTEKATVAPHVLKFELTGTALGKDVSITANHTVSIRQEIRIEQGGLKMAPDVVAGDSVSMTLPIMNMGKADVVNVLATVTMPGITECQSVLVGTIQPGETKQAQMLLSPAKDVTGEFSGEITVECTDQDGNPASFTLPVNLEVRPPKKETETNADGETVKKEKANPLVPALGGACGLLLVLLVIQGIVLRRKLHRLEEEKL